MSLSDVQLPVSDPRHVLLKATDREFVRSVIRSLLVVGAPRSGKFWGVRRNLVDWFNEESGAFLGLFPHPHENGPLVALDADLEGHGHRIEFDWLDDPNHCYPCIVFPRSHHPSPYVRAMENTDFRDNLLALLGRNRKEPIEQQTTVIELATHAIQLCQEADLAHVTFEHLLAVGKEGHPLNHELLDECPNSELSWYWNRIPKQGAVVRKDLAALWRLTEQKFGDVRILARQTTVDALREKLMRKGILIFNGSESLRATRTFLGIIGMSMKQALRAHFAETGESLDVLELWDEVQSQGVTEFEVHALREMVKMGLHSLWIAHSPRLLFDPAENEDLLQLFQAIRAHHCGSYRIGLEIAYVAGARGFDPYLEHSRTTRTVQRHDGFDVEPTVTKSKSRGKRGDDETENETETHGERLVPRYMSDTEETIKYVDLDDQAKIIASRLMQLGPQECLTSMAGHVAWETIPRLEEPWIFPEIGKLKLQQLLDRLHERPEYKKPSLPKPVEMPSLPSSASTPRRSTNSSNGHNGHWPKSSPSAATVALRDVLMRSGRRRDVP